MTEPSESAYLDGVEEIGQAFRSGLEGILAGKLIGIYLYGATVFPETKYTGDIDFHVILDESLTVEEREGVNALHESLAFQHPPLGQEMDGYYLLMEDAKKKSPPRSQMWKQATDNSWALHREHIRAGKCIVLYGPDPALIYPATTWDELEAALRDELAYVERHLFKYPAYCALNLCRLMYSFQTRDVVVSKTAAGVWADSIYPQWSELITTAGKSYKGLSTASDDQFMLDQIQGLYKFARKQIGDNWVDKEDW
jgi:hypothetical protein